MKQPFLSLKPRNSSQNTPPLMSSIPFLITEQVPQPWAEISRAANVKGRVHSMSRLFATLNCHDVVGLWTGFKSRQAGQLVRLGRIQAEAWFKATSASLATFSHSKTSDRHYFSKEYVLKFNVLSLNGDVGSIEEMHSYRSLK
jgi:hypothetical protein